MNELKPVLSTYYPHIRDHAIEFFEDGHKYIIKTDPNSKYTSVTTWNHSHFPHFDSDKIIKNMMKGPNWKEGHKYWGLSAEQIKQMWKNNATNVSSAGTDLHFKIECFMNNPHLNPDYTHKELIEYYERLSEYNDEHDAEWVYFINFVYDYAHLKPYRTEWMIYHEELKLAGSIDMVYENADGTLSIYDWKRCKEITRVNNFNKYAITDDISSMPDSNFWHYSLQLNTYKAILEEKYGKIVKELYLVKLHPNDPDNNYELIKVPILKNEIKSLFEKRKLEIQSSNKM